MKVFCICYLVFFVELFSCFVFSISLHNHHLYPTSLSFLLRLISPFFPPPYPSIPLPTPISPSLSLLSLSLPTPFSPLPLYYLLPLLCPGKGWVPDLQVPGVVNWEGAGGDEPEPGTRDQNLLHINSTNLKSNRD